jgi:nicotinate phosphoribosyltransferase
MFNILSEKEIAEGEATDAYFERTEEALEEAGRNPEVVAEITHGRSPDGDYTVFTGVEDAANLLEGLDLDVYALEEGSLTNGGPVMRIEGNYLEFARYETALLGFLSDHSGKATAALEAKRAAPDTPVLSFGARHVNPSIAPMIERNALIAGLDGFSLVAAEEYVDGEASGTMPHALILSFGKENQKEAWSAFDEGVDEDVPRVALCDTFNDEIKEVEMAVEALGDELDGVRLDTTSSRRGKFDEIIEEVNYKLRELGRSDVDVIVSGGLGPEEIRELRDMVDGFGVGSHISNADPVDYGLDIVEINGSTISKRGKLGGKKSLKIEDNEVVMNRRGDGNRLKELIKDGEIVRDFSIEKANRNLNEDKSKLL